MNQLLCFCMLLFISCQKHAESIGSTPVDDSTFEKQGHRGCRGLMPENTIPAMLKALDLRVTNLEMDLAITKDQQVIVSHDPYFNHAFSTKPNGEAVSQSEENSLRFYDMNYEQIKSFDVGLRQNPDFPQQQTLPAKVPLLGDLIDGVENYTIQKGLRPVTYNIEIKSSPGADGIFYPAVDKYVELVVSLILSKNIQNRTNISSFDKRALQYLHQHYPVITTTYNTESFGDIINEINQLGFDPAYVAPLYLVVTQDLIQKLQQRKIKVVAWTVDDKQTIDNLKKMGVNGVVTDYPNLFN